MYLCQVKLSQNTHQVWKVFESRLDEVWKNLPAQFDHKRRATVLEQWSAHRDLHIEDDILHPMMIDKNCNAADVNKPAN